MSSRIKMRGPDGAGKLVEQNHKVVASNEPAVISPGLAVWRMEHHNPYGVYDDENYSYSHRKFSEKPKVLERSDSPIDFHAVASSVPKKSGMLARLFGGRK